jgi:phosphatidylserine/phosphatidylglycerophosphate/cardiolipin synthase-like enzyme
LARGILFVLAFCVNASIAHSFDLRFVDGDKASVYFSPKGNAIENLLDRINDAQNTILVQAYSFTSDEIAGALIDAHKYGKNVEVILDKSQRGKRVGFLLKSSGINVRYDYSHAIAHNKIMIIDNRTVITGSYNFTKAAEERNAENLLIIDSKELAKPYLENWLKHRAHSN